VSKAETEVGEECRGALGEAESIQNSEKFSWGDTVQADALNDLESNSNFQNLKPYQQDALRGVVKSTSNLLRVLQSGAEALAQQSQKSANRDADKLASRPRQMNPGQPLRKREKYWRENVANQNSVGRSLREFFFGTKFEFIDLAQYFGDKDLTDLMRIYFVEHFMNDIYATEYKHATSWSVTTA
jgi:hypothetical protein